MGLFPRAISPGTRMDVHGEHGLPPNRRYGTNHHTPTSSCSLSERNIGVDKARCQAELEGCASILMPTPKQVFGPDGHPTLCCQSTTRTYAWTSGPDIPDKQHRTSLKTSYPTTVCPTLDEVTGDPATRQECGIPSAAALASILPPQLGDRMSEALSAPSTWCASTAWLWMAT